MKKIILILISIFMGIAIFEIYLKFNKDKLSLIDNHLVSSSVFNLDSDLIYSHAPNATIVLETDEFHEVTQLNSKGIKGKEIKEKDESIYRIITVGDSFTYGYGLNYEKTYSFRLQEKLNNQNRTKKVEIVNAGVWGYGIDQEYKLIKQRLVQLHPSVIIWNLTYPNDFYDMSPGFSWTIPSLYDYKEEKLIPLDARFNWLYSSSFLYKNFPLLHNLDVFNLLVKTASTGNYFNRRPHLTYEQTLEWGSKKTFAQIKDINSLANKKGFNLIIAFLPQIEAFEKNQDPVFNVVENIKNNIKKENISLIDVKDGILETYKDKKNIQSLYFPIDGHPNTLGADVFADIIWQFLKDKLNE